MKRTITPKFNYYLRARMEPKKSTLNFIKAFAAAYEFSKDLNKKVKYPGLILN